MVIALSRAHGVSRLIEDARSGGELTNIDVFPTLDRTCTTEFTQGGSFQRIAEPFTAVGARSKSPPANRRPMWDELDDGLKESNRAQARDILRKLRKIGCGIGPLRDWAGFEFTKDEVEELAFDEHDRWVDEREKAGWQLGSPKDTARKISPYLVPYKDLPEDIKELDRSAVRGIPAALAAAGFQVIRVSRFTDRSA